jgi:hypothetical protein
VLLKSLKKCQLEDGYRNKTWQSRVVGFVDPDKAGSSPSSDTVNYLVAVSNKPLAQLIAQQIFSAFMWAIADSVKAVDAEKP